MSQTFAYEGEHEFVEKLKELRAGGTDPERITTITPVPVHGLDELVGKRASMLKFFTLIGGLTGCFTGYGLCIYTVYRWATPDQPWGLIVAGKPPVSFPAYTVIGFELTVLFAALVSLFGFLLLARMPRFTQLVPEKEYPNQFIIEVSDEERP